MNRLGASLLAGAAAALGLLLVQLGAGLTGEARSWTAVYWALCTIAFSAAGASSRVAIVRRLWIAGLGVGSVWAGWVGMLPEWQRFSAEGMLLLALALAVVFGGVRSGLLDAGANLNPRRVLLVEAVLGASALLFAGWLSGPAPVGPALSIWGFALVQSLYACIPRSYLARSSQRPHAKFVDPFDAACSKLAAVLGEPMR